MGSCLSKPTDAGYATPAALLLSLGLALVGAAIVARSVQTLNLSRNDLEITRHAYVLDGAQLLAAATVIRSGVPGPYRWSFSSDLGWVEAIAEPEKDKLSFQAAAALDDAVFTGLGVAEPEALRARLLDAADLEVKPAVIDLDAAPVWKRCAPTLISPIGDQSEPLLADRVEPGPGPDPPAWHVGEVWRVRVATEAGWRDDRIVRFTGDARHPTATVERRFTKGGRVAAGCERLLKELLAG